jgi:SAM-dependent methyltransferase
VLCLQVGPCGLAAEYRRQHPQSQWTSVDLESPDAALPEGVFDLIVLPQALNWLGDPQGLLKALAARMSDGGRLFLTCTHHGGRDWLEHWLNADLSTDPRQRLGAGQPRLTSVSTVFKLLLDSGWLPHLRDAEPGPAWSPEAQAALRDLTRALGYSTGGCPERVHSLGELVIEAHLQDRDRPRRTGPASFDVLVPTNDERQLRVNIEASPGLAEVHARVVSVRGASDPAQACVLGAEQLQSDWVLICHQDVYFPEGFGEQLNAVLDAIPAAERSRTLLGFIGMAVDRQTQACGPAGLVTDRLHCADYSASDSAVSIDELALVVSRDTLHRIDPSLGWHLWATDLCLGAICTHKVFPRIVRLPVFHNSRTGWQNPAGFETSVQTLAAKWAGFGAIQTLCGVIDAAGGPALAA